MFQTKVTFDETQTPEQRKAHAAHWRRRDAERRMINDGFGFWQACSKPLCRRKRSCSGDMHACFTRRWALVPEDQKEYLRGCLKALKHTKSPDELHRAGVAAREAYLQHQGRIDALFAASGQGKPVAAARPEPDAAPSEPRIRRL